MRNCKLINKGAGLIAALYVVTSLVWIFGSDQAANLIFDDIDVLTTVQSIKGTAFVLATGLGLYVIINVYRRYLDGGREALEHSENQVHEIIEHSRTPEVLIDPESLRVTFLNSVGEEFLGLSPDTEARADDIVCVPTGDSDEGGSCTIRPHIDAVLQGDNHQVICNVRAADGQARRCEIRFSITPLGGQTLIRLSLIDVSEVEKRQLLLNLLGEGLGSHIGYDFMSEFVSRLSVVLGAEATYIGELETIRGERLIKPRVAWVNGQHADLPPVPEEGTPCGHVIRNGMLVVEKDVLQMFPAAEPCAVPGLVGYAGIALKNRDGDVIGLIAIQTTTPIQNRRLTIDILRAAATRVEVELERVSMEQQLRDSEARLRSLIDEASQGILVHQNFRPVYVNPALAKMFDFGSVEDVLKLDNVSSLFDPSETDQLREYNRARLEGRPAPAEYTFTGITKNGKRKKIQNRVVRVPWGDDFAVCGNFFDITEQEALRKVAQQSQRLEAIGKLTGGIAHDFNNLLGIVQGNLQLLERRIGDDETAANRISGAIGATKRGAQLTRRLLSFSRQDAFSGEVTDINETIDEFQDMLARSLTSEISVEFHPGDDLWLTEIDPGDLCDAVLNLALNARDAMPEGGRLVVETKNQRFGAGDTRPNVEPGDYVVLSVSDTGTGMPPDVLEQVFEPFFTTKEAANGTGLGLSMVYGFAKRSRGDVRIYSEPGHGTTLRLYLPRSTNATTLAPAPEKATAAPRGGNETILVVDDESELLELASNMLSGLGYRVHAAGDGPSALRLLGEHADIDLVLSDVIMPGGVDGFQVARQARELRPNIKVILASGFTGRTAGNGADPVLAKNMIAKPYDLDELATVIRSKLSEQREMTSELESQHA